MKLNSSKDQVVGRNLRLTLGLYHTVIDFVWKPSVHQQPFNGIETKISKTAMCSGHLVLNHFRALWIIYTVYRPLGKVNDFFCRKSVRLIFNQPGFFWERLSSFTKVRVC